MAYLPERDAFNYCAKFAIITLHDQIIHNNLVYISHPYNLEWLTTA